ncbi:MAG: TlpA family protein disulfide reductase [Bacteroidota bacterium]|nr:TlpA family protein disulfide reductase [Bacteroidota bacterium]
MIIGGLYFTGLHTEVLGKIQSIILYTGILKPNIDNDRINSTEVPLEGSSLNMAGKDFQMKSLNGVSLNMESLYGKTVFLNLWATWCPPCIAEMPNIQQLYNQVHSEDIVFLMLSLDNDLEKPKKFIEKKGYTFPVYLPEGTLHSDFQTNAIPTTFVISPKGKIVSKQEGMANYNTKEFKEFLLNLE